MTGSNQGRLRWLLSITALMAGTFDISYATGFSYVRSGVPPSRVLQFVASGALGSRRLHRRDRGRGDSGLGFHYLFALIFTAFFFAAARAMPSLRRRPVVTGVIYGIGIYLVMNFVAFRCRGSGHGPWRPRSSFSPGCSCTCSSSDADLLEHDGPSMVGSAAARAQIVRYPGGR